VTFLQNLILGHIVRIPVEVLFPFAFLSLSSLYSPAMELPTKALFSSNLNIIPLIFNVYIGKIIRRATKIEFYFYNNSSSKMRALNLNGGFSECL